MPDSPKPSGTTVTHADVRAIAQAHLTQWPGTEEALLAYVEQQEAAERERGTDYKMMFEVAEEKLNEYIDKTVEAERKLESERAVCRLATASKENYRKLREAAEKRAETAERALAERQARAADNLDFPLTVEVMRDRLCEVLQTSFHSPLCTPELLDKVLERLKTAEAEVANWREELQAEKDSHMATAVLHGEYESRLESRVEQARREGYERGKAEQR